MEIRDLRYFEAVARNKKFIGAADELHISQPSLSNTIKHLENKLGYKLIERSTKELSLTEFGEVFYNHIDYLLHQFDNTIKEIEHIGDLGEGKIKIGIIESFKYFMPKIINQFKQIYPEMGLQVMEMSSTSILESLENYEIHLGITSSIKSNEQIKFSSIAKEKLSLAIPINHRFKGLDSIDVNDLKEETLIHSLSGFGLRETLIDACKAAGFNPRIQYEIESLEMASNLVENGLGVSVIPEGYIKFKPNKKICIVPFTKFVAERTIYTAYHSRRYLPKAMYDLILMIEKISLNSEK